MYIVVTAKASVPVGKQLVHGFLTCFVDAQLTLVVPRTCSRTDRKQAQVRATINGERAPNQQSQQRVDTAARREQRVSRSMATRKVKQFC